ncbi:OmpA family protein [Aquimarina pacifica]|uniref:OmpA family protein n=1 Tax=Aquimarina pacifica TaxID=1296415 RepID=UPI00046FB25C|nr:OmpA family protein [Aquimarina pacifica]
MNKNIHIVLVISIIFFFGLSGMAQQKILDIADEQFSNYQYVSAQETYLKILKTGYESPKVFKNLADSYYLNGQLEEASKWYKELIESYPDEILAEDTFRYAQSLKSIGDYEGSDVYMQEFLVSDEANKDYLKRIDYQSGRYTIENVAINSPFTDFGSTIYDDFLVFSSSRDTLLFNKKIHKWTEESFLVLYKASIDQETGELSDPTPFAEELNTKFHESTPAFSKDGNTMYFTRNSNKKNKDRMNILHIYQSSKNAEGQWSIPEKLSFGDENYSAAHPAMSPDGSVLYFSSDMPGGFGESDIYSMTVYDDGSFGAPINLGRKINTLGKDTFPFLSEDNELYFSSDGHQGLGGLDVFMINLNEDSNEVINVGKPVNSSRDDFAFIINAKSKKGYFSSNREGGEGGDDVYRFEELLDIKSFDINKIVGEINDKEDLTPIEGAIVSIYDEQELLIDTQVVKEDGAFSFSSEELKNAHTIKVRKDGYIPYEHTIDKTEFSDTYFKRIQLEKDKEELIQAVDEDLVETEEAFMDGLENAFRFEMIVDPSHFIEFSDALTYRSTVKLERIVVLMKRYSRVSAEIKVYTDDYNGDLRMAQSRAESVYNYMKNQGIPSSKLRYEGVQRGTVKLEKKLNLMMVVPMPIHFDLDSRELRQKSEIGLNKVIEIMSFYPTMKMGVHGHADSRSSYWYNKKLSVDRMRSAISYIEKNGNINWRRLRGKAYGERKLVNNCDNNTDCPEEEHERNRRCEFIIID